MSGKVKNIRHAMASLILVFLFFAIYYNVADFNAWDNIEAGKHVALHICNKSLAVVTQSTFSPRYKVLYKMLYLNYFDII